MPREITEIRKVGERAANLTRQLLAFSRKQVLTPKVFEMNEVVAGVSEMLARFIGGDIEFRTSFGKDLWTVKADPGQIEQAIMNLAINARDAMPEGGTLTIQTENIVLSEPIPAGTAQIPPGPYVVLAISDTGIGMDEVTLSHLFEPFFTTKEKGKGTGLGLAMVYGIVKQSGGFIIEEILGMQGYTVLKAANGEEALQLSRASDEKIQMLLTDMVMPSMSGKELAERMKQALPGLKVLFMSGHAAGDAAMDAILSAGENFLSKPFTLSDLKAGIPQLAFLHGSHRIIGCGGIPRGSCGAGFVGIQDGGGRLHARFFPRCVTREGNPIRRVLIEDSTRVQHLLH